MKSTDNKIVSIIIPCYNELKYTKMCIESLFRYTRYPYELVVIDNGSGPETRQFFTDTLEPRENVKVIYNTKNLGAPKAFNQGIESAQGEYLLFLNNDTIVTYGWLGRLVGHIKRENKCGIVGACTNRKWNTLSEFPLTNGYRNEREIQETAAFIALKNRGKVKAVPSVTSFCMLTAKKIIRQVGMFDENYGYGTNDDHDFCMRVGDAGYKIICAFDTLVFHFYSRTLGKLEVNKLDRRNREYFVWKFKERGIRFFEKVNQPYGKRGERPFARLRNMSRFI